jgi:hypothetical protein
VRQQSFAHDLLDAFVGRDQALVLGDGGPALQPPRIDRLGQRLDPPAPHGGLFARPLPADFRCKPGLASRQVGIETLGQPRLDRLEAHAEERPKRSAAPVDEGAGDQMVYRSSVAAEAELRLEGSAGKEDRRRLPPRARVQRLHVREKPVRLVDRDRREDHRHARESVEQPGSGEAVARREPDQVAQH